MRTKRNDKNLAEGEVTGHAHRCVGDVEVYNIDGGRELDAPDGCTVTHEEHNTIELPPGRYDTIIAVERDHAAEEAREVRD